MQSHFAKVQSVQFRRRFLRAVLCLLYVPVAIRTGAVLQLPFLDDIASAEPSAGVCTKVKFKPATASQLENRL